MKLFELSAKKKRNGRRPFKVVLHEIYPDDCVINQLGQQHNGNGICWIESYCKNNLDSIAGMSLTAEFLDEEKTQLCGHGVTGIEDGIPIFDNATIIGNFERGYIDDVEVDGKQIKAAIGEGTIDQMRCNEFVKSLEENLNNGNTISGSVEICRSDNCEAICYLGNNSGKSGRIPTVFDYSGFALLGVQPADKASTLLELNNKDTKGEKYNMEKIESMLSDVLSKIDKTEGYKAELEINAQTIAEQNASIEELKSAIEQVKAERDEAYRKLDELYAEQKILQEEIVKLKVKERVGELNQVLGQFSDEQKKYAETEIEAFNADPMASEINSIVDKIHIEIGKKALDDAKVQAELNAAKAKEVVDIFSEINSVGSNNEEVDIYK